MAYTLTILSFCLVLTFGIRAWLEIIKPFRPPQWEAVPVEGNEGLEGWKVQWSEPNANGDYLEVTRYTTESASLYWCEMAAKTDADSRNSSCQLPSDFPAWKTEELD